MKDSARDCHCRLERLVFSESFVRECDNEVDTNVPPILNPGFGSKSADLAAERCRDFIHSNLRRQQVKETPEFHVIYHL